MRRSSVATSRRLSTSRCTDARKRLRANRAPAASVRVARISAFSWSSSAWLFMSWYTKPTSSPCDAHGWTEERAARAAFAARVGGDAGTAIGGGGRKAWLLLLLLLLLLVLAPISGWTAGYSKATGVAISDPIRCWRSAS